MNPKILLPLFVAALLGFGGCAAIRQSEAGQTERSLAAAGFQAKPVDTPQRQQAVASLTPYKLQSRNHKGNIVYLYSDPSQNVVYVGGPKEYSAYQRIAVRQEMIAQQQMTALEYQSWGPWGYGGGWGYPGMVW